MFKWILGYTVWQYCTQVTLRQWLRGRVALCRSGSPRRPVRPVVLRFNRHSRTNGLPRLRNLPVSSAYLSTHGHKGRVRTTSQTTNPPPRPWPGEYVDILTQSISTQLVGLVATSVLSLGVSCMSPIARQPKSMLSMLGSCSSPSCKYTRIQLDFATLRHIFSPQINVLR